MYIYICIDITTTMKPVSQEYKHNKQISDVSAYQNVTVLRTPLRTATAAAAATADMHYPRPYILLFGFFVATGVWGPAGVFPLPMISKCVVDRTLIRNRSTNGCDRLAISGLGGIRC